MGQNTVPAEIKNAKTEELKKRRARTDPFFMTATPPLQGGYDTANLHVGMACRQWTAYFPSTGFS